MYVDTILNPLGQQYDSVCGHVGTAKRDGILREWSSRLECGREDAAVWFQHAPKMCKVLEAYVREAARSQAAGRLSPVLQHAADLAAAVVSLINPMEAGMYGPLLQAAAGPGCGSKEQQQLHGLLRSMLKWASVMGQQQQVLAEQLRVAAAAAVANILLAACRVHQQGGTGAAALSEAEGSTAAEDDRASSSAAKGGCGSHHESSSSEQPSQRSGPTQAAAPAATQELVLPRLPWLGVLGCCCLQWSQQLGSLPTDSPAVAAAAARSGLLHDSKGVITALPEDQRSVWGTAVERLGDGRTLVVLCVEAFDTWLNAMGSLPEQLMPPIEPGQVENCHSAIMGCYAECPGLTVQTTIEQHPDAPVPLAGYVQQLSLLGEALCSVAHKQSCNNPTCSNLGGPSELQLVKGRSSTCSGCRTARYCSPECMRRHWKQHRPVCKAMARTAAVATAAQAAVAAAGPRAGP